MVDAGRHDSEQHLSWWLVVQLAATVSRRPCASSVSIHLMGAKVEQLDDSVKGGAQAHR